MRLVFFFYTQLHGGQTPPCGHIDQPPLYAATLRITTYIARSSSILAVLRPASVAVQICRNPWSFRLFFYFFLAVRSNTLLITMMVAEAKPRGVHQSTHQHYAAYIWCSLRHAGAGFINFNGKFLLLEAVVKSDQKFFLWSRFVFVSFTLFSPVYELTNGRNACLLVICRAQAAVEPVCRRTTCLSALRCANVF